jgi:hypothetical protein
MSRTEGRLSTSVFCQLLVLLWLGSPLLLHAQDPASPENANAFPSNVAGRSFHPYSAQKNRIPPMQPEFAQTSGFNWAQFFKSAAETGTRLAAPRMFQNTRQLGMTDSSFFRAGSASNGTYGDSFNLSSRGVNFSTKSSALDLHLSVQSMFAGGFSPGGGGSSFAGSSWNTSGQSLGMPGGMGGLGGLGSRDAQKGSGAKVSLQLKF